MQKAWVSGLGLLLLGSVISLYVGVIDIGITAIFNDPEKANILITSRIPRTIAIILTGASMAVAGLVMQMIVCNRFVEPMTAGGGQCAALGVLLVSLFYPGASIFIKILIASVVALIGSSCFLIMVRRLPAHQPLLIPLVGLIYGGVIGAIVTFIAYQTDLMQYIAIWFTGEFSGILEGRYELLWLAGILTLVAYVVADQFAILGLGRSVSINLGLRYKDIVRLGLLIVSLISAITVVTVGIIPFVGLVVPNIISLWLGDNLRKTLPITALMGANLVLFSDLVGRLARYPFEIPVGTIFGILGSILFLWFLYGRRPNAH